jgi:hypothetical protein
MVIYLTLIFPLYGDPIYFIFKIVSNSDQYIIICTFSLPHDYIWLEMTLTMCMLFYCPDSDKRRTKIILVCNLQCYCIVVWRGLTVRPRLHSPRSGFARPQDYALKWAYWVHWTDCLWSLGLGMNTSNSYTSIHWRLRRTLYSIKASSFPNRRIWKSRMTASVLSVNF